MDPNLVSILTSIVSDSNLLAFMRYAATQALNAMPADQLAMRNAALTAANLTGLLPEYADSPTALSAGMQAGQFFRTGENVKQVIPNS